jgi:hypothetical protein
LEIDILELEDLSGSLLEGEVVEFIVPFLASSTTLEVHNSSFFNFNFLAISGSELRNIWEGFSLGNFSE